MTRGEKQGWITGLEPATSGTTIRRSNQLSYTHHVASMRQYRFTRTSDDDPFCADRQLRHRGAESRRSTRSWRVACRRRTRISVRKSRRQAIASDTGRESARVEPGGTRHAGYLQGFLTPQRRERFEEVLAQRTRMLRVVLEDVYQPHNQSAVLRTAEALGLQDVHLVESANRWGWTGRFRWEARLVDDPSSHGRRRRRVLSYAITTGRVSHSGGVAGSEATPLPEIVVEQPTALVIGHETAGVSQAALELADDVRGHSDARICRESQSVGCGGRRPRSSATTARIVRP